MVTGNVTIKWDRDRPARLIREGDEVSEVMWLDDRSVQCVCNNQIEREGEK